MTMNKRLPYCLTLLSLSGLAAACGQATPEVFYTGIEHGRYLTERVGMCQDCHSPRDARGEFVRASWLQGSQLPFAPSVEMPWAPAAPPIAGLPSLTDEQAVTFLTNGVLPGGRRARPPMPEFRFAERDARHVVRYLRSLGKTDVVASR